MENIELQQGIFCHCYISSSWVFKISIQVVGPEKAAYDSMLKTLSC